MIELSSGEIYVLVAFTFAIISILVIGVGILIQVSHTRSDIQAVRRFVSLGRGRG